MTQHNTHNDHQVEQQEEELDESNCIRCQQPATFMCSSCGINGPRYCSTECQKLHWKTDHYLTCKATQIRQQEQNRQPNETNINNSNNNNNNNNNPFNEEGQSTIVANNDIELNDIRRSTNNETTTITTTTNNNLDSEEFADNLKFYMQQIYLIIKPVVVCIVLSIFWVKVGFSDESDYSPTRPTYTVLQSNNAGTSSSGGSNSGSTSSSGLTSLANAGIIIGQIIIVTVVIVFFFRKGWIKVLIGFFMLVVLFLLGFMTYLLILNLIQVFYIPLDYITLSIALWNFVVVGLLSIFWKGPLWLQQAYLTVLSSLMAFSLTGLEQWTTWILLGLLAVWDLIAVLCPFGPLRLLIESSRNQQREVPALLYSVNAVWFMLASPNHIHPTITKEYVSISMKKETFSSASLKDIDISNHHHVQQQQQHQLNHKPSIQSMDSVDHYQPSTISSIVPINQYASSTLINQSKNTIDTQNDLEDDNDYYHHNNTPSTIMMTSMNHNERISHDGYIRLQEDHLQSNNNMIPTNNSSSATINNNHTTVNNNNNNNNDTSDIRRRSTDGRNNNNNNNSHNENIPTDNQTNPTEEIRDEEDVERSGLKLGLGDFVFYSVLVARAAMYDWITTVCCTIAVLTGLTATIFLLAIYKKALPALPISIAFGILFYFVAKTVLVPYITISVLAMVGL